MIYLDDLVLHEAIPCGQFTLSRAEIVAFAERFDPQAFHLSDEGGRASHFGRLVASGVHTQAAAIGLVVRTLSDLAVVAGRSLNTARFHRPTYPNEAYTVSVRWSQTRLSARDDSRGDAILDGTVHDAAGRLAAEFGITYVLRRRPSA